MAPHPMTVRMNVGLMILKGFYMVLLQFERGLVYPLVM